MLLSEIFLDQAYLDSLEMLAIREGWITENKEPIYSPIDMEDVEDRESTRVYYRGKVLLLMTLFQTIDSHYSAYSFNKFSHYGVVKQDGLLNSDKDDPAVVFWDNVTEENYEIMSLAHRNTYELLHSSKNKVITHVIRVSDKGFYIHGSKTRVNQNDLSNEYENILNSFLLYDDTSHIENKKTHLSKFIGEFAFIYSSIRAGIYHSIKNGSCTATIFGSNSFQPKHHTDKLIDDLYYLVKTNLSDEIKILPKPRCIDEALELREKPQMIRFREVLNEWLNTLIISESAAERKIHDDLKKANRELKITKQWAEYQKSPFNFWLNAIGGHIPVLSNILSVVNTTSALLSKNKRKKNDWIGLINN